MAQGHPSCPTAIMTSSSSHLILPDLASSISHLSNPTSIHISPASFLVSSLCFSRECWNHCIGRYPHYPLTAALDFLCYSQRSVLHSCSAEHRANLGQVSPINQIRHQVQADMLSQHLSLDHNQAQVIQDRLDKNNHILNHSKRLRSQSQQSQNLQDRSRQKPAAQHRGRRRERKCENERRNVNEQTNSRKSRKRFKRRRRRMKKPSELQRRKRNGSKPEREKRMRENERRGND